MQEYLTVEQQYQLYLKRVALSEDTMHPQQRIQLRQTFFGAWGQALIFMRDDVGSEEDEERAIDVLKTHEKEVMDYFTRAVTEQKSRNPNMN
jgi:hypothetical protein